MNVDTILIKTSKPQQYGGTFTCSADAAAGVGRDSTVDIVHTSVDTGIITTMAYTFITELNISNGVAVGTFDCSSSPRIQHVGEQ